MTCFAYLHKDGADLGDALVAIEKYAAMDSHSIDEVVSDEDSIKTHWRERQIGRLIKHAQANDIIIVFDASQLACSTSQILEILSAAAGNHVHIYFVKYNLNVINTTDNIDTQHILQVIGRIESDFISKRTTQALARRRAAGLPLGRPKGRGNKSLKLDKHKADIKRYLELGISKASIAKLVDCHPQTLYDWIDRNDIAAEK